MSAHEHPHDKPQPAEVRDIVAVLARGIHLDLQGVGDGAFPVLPEPSTFDGRITASGLQLLAELVTLSSPLAKGLTYTSPDLQSGMIEAALDEFNTSPTVFRLLGDCHSCAPDASLPDKAPEHLAAVARGTHEDIKAVNADVFAELSDDPTRHERMIRTGAKLLVELVYCSSFLATGLRGLSLGVPSSGMLEAGLARFRGSGFIRHLKEECPGFEPVDSP